MAAKGGHFEIFKILYERNAKIDVWCAMGNQILQPIHIACKNGHSSIVSYIISVSRNIKATVCQPIDTSRSTPLHLAAQGGHLSICESLLMSGASYLAINRFGDTFLHNSIRNEHSNFTLSILAFYQENKGTLLTSDEMKKPYPMDVENN